MSQSSRRPDVAAVAASAAAAVAPGQGNKIFLQMRTDALKIEEGMKGAENEVLRKEEEAYLMHRHDAEISHLKKLHQDEVAEKKLAFQKFIAARDARKKAKKLERQTIRDMKRRDAIIMEQEAASKEAARVKSTLTMKRAQFDALLAYLENKHDKQRRQLYAAQDRKIQYEKMINNMEYAHERDEIKRTMQKKFQVLMTHQKSVDKRLADQLREIQQMELKHTKENFDLEFQSYEDIHNLKAMHVKGVCELTAAQAADLHAEKERLISQREQTKLTILEARHVVDMKKLALGHRDQLRQLRVQQEHRQGQHAHQSRMTISTLDDDDIHSKSDTVSNRGRRSPYGADSSTIDDQSDYYDGDDNETQDRLQSSAVDVIRKLSSKHKDAIAALKEMYRTELSKLEVQIGSRKRELEENQACELRELCEAHARDLEALRTVQAKEVQMEASVHEAEAKMLVERRVLNSVLSTVVDGIININPKGKVSRFNRAAENMFGYKSDEVLGRNIKMLMPPEIADQHDGYLNNYFTTGIARIIGSGRRAFGMKKNGTTFPVHISVSEVLEEGAHLFTGIIRDLTEEVRLEDEQRAKDEKKRLELTDLLKELDISKAKADDILSQMLPPAIQVQLMAGQPIVPEAFDQATVFYSDICGFTEISSKSTPMQMVQLLNSLYTTFDGIISKYDAYKVETIGDSYMVASGVPRRNNDRHACEIADMALHMLSAISTFSLPDRPELKLRMRIGMHSGPVVAGVVGLKMPRYCLFGSTTTEASRMESSGQPMRIQVSEATYKLLQRDGSYELVCRTDRPPEAKGRTYWLVGKDNFYMPLPEETLCLSTNCVSIPVPATLSNEAEQ